MIFIAHRGNLEGPSKKENHPDQIIKVLGTGINVEVDVWMINNKFYLGHDEPQHELDHSNFLKHPFLWCHAKNIDALYYMINLGVHCFWHQEDDVAITSKGHIWTYPGRQLTSNSICVMPELTKYSPEEMQICHAICTDYPYQYRDLIGEI